MRVSAAEAFFAVVNVIVQGAELFERPRFDGPAGLDAAGVRRAEMAGDAFASRVPVAFNRPVVASGILAVLREDKWVIEKESHFREFMKSLNILGSGVAFEVLDQSAVKALMSRCVAHARAARLIAERAEPAIDA